MTTVKDIINDMFASVSSTEKRPLTPEQVAENKRRVEESWLTAIGGCGIPERTRPAMKSPRNTQAIVAAQAYIDDRDARILVLSGSRGCGKTVAAAWVVSQRITFDDDALIPEYRAPGGVRFIDVSELARLNRYSDESMRPVERASLLVIDDLGMEYNDEKGSFLATFDGIFNARYSRDLRTVITTNLPSAEFKKRYGERVADRIRECGKFIELSDKSLRGAK